MLNEEIIVELLAKEFPNYIGDDAAVIPFNGDRRYVVTKDLLIEDIHFRKSYFDPESLAHKALHVNLSDIAAIGGTAKYVFMGAGLPQEYGGYGTAFVKAFCKLCKEMDLILAGGDTVLSKNGFFISITLIGIAESRHLKFRKGAKFGDCICIAGDLGHAHIGLTALERRVGGLKMFKNKCLRPIAKKNEGVFLGESEHIHAMMDISDGLLIDLKRLCARSKVGAEIELERLAPSDLFIAGCKELGLNPLEAMMIGGEDYGLLVIVDPSEYEEVFEQFQERFGYPLKQIGHIVDRIGVHFKKDGEEKSLNFKPFSHFNEF